MSTLPQTHTDMGPILELQEEGIGDQRGRRSDDGGSLRSGQVGDGEPSLLLGLAEGPHVVNELLQKTGIAVPSYTSALLESRTNPLDGSVNPEDEEDIRGSAGTLYAGMSSSPYAPYGIYAYIAISGRGYRRSYLLATWSCFFIAFPPSRP